MLLSGDIRAAYVPVVDPLISETYNISCFLAPILKPCSLYGGFVAAELYP